MIRKNASLRTVAEVTFRKANRAHTRWAQQRVSIQRAMEKGHVDFSARSEEQALWAHFRELDEIAEHLLRLTGKTPDDIKAMKDAARFPRKEAANV